MRTSQVNNDELTYTKAGVDTAKEDIALDRMLKYVKKSFDFREDYHLSIDIGYFANVINLGRGLGLAVTTDGVGTKILIAHEMDKYDTIGIDCIAMNVNDLLGVGAEPISFLDYLAVSEINPDLLEEISKGLLKGAEISKVTISGGEIAQLKNMLKSGKKGYEFDIVGMALGIVPINKIIIGENIKENDAIVGLRSNGVHSNGITLARKALSTGNTDFNQYFDELGKSIGEELLEPTHIYVPEIMDMLNSELNVKALVHITSDGFLNLTRVKADVGYVIDYLPEPHPIFSLIKRLGNIPDAEMYRVYNMGIGFCVVLPQEEVEDAIQISKKHGVDAYKIGYTVEDKERKVTITPKGLIGKKGYFYEM